MSIETGALAEKWAKDYLVAQGLSWVESHYRSRYGEIDLIMREAKHLVFVEVRYRYAKSFGEAFESVNVVKQKKLWTTASQYLACHRAHLKEQVRFDVVGIQGKPHQIVWIKDAFRWGW